MVNFFEDNLKKKIGKEEVEIEDELHEWLKEFWENHEREREERIRSETIFQDLEKVENNIEKFSNKMENKNHSISKAHIKEMFSKVDHIEKFIDKLERDVKIKIKYEKKLLHLTDLIYKHTDRQRKELKKLYRKAN